MNIDKITKVFSEYIDKLSSIEKLEFLIRLPKDINECSYIPDEDKSKVFNAILDSMQRRCECGEGMS